MAAKKMTKKPTAAKPPKPPKKDDSSQRAERQRQNRMRKPSTSVSEPNYYEMEMRAYGPGSPGVGGARYVTPKPMTASESVEYRRQTRNGARGGKSVRAVPLKPKGKKPLRGVR